MPGSAKRCRVFYGNWKNTMFSDEEFEALPDYEPAWATLDRIAAYRKRLLRAGYLPLPVCGKRVGLENWPNVIATDALISQWAQQWPDHLSTGVLTRTVPFVDIDVTDEERPKRSRHCLKARLRIALSALASHQNAPFRFGPIRPSRRWPDNLPRRMVSFIKSKFSVTASNASSPAFIPTPASPTAGTVASRGPSSAARICRQ